MRGFDSLRRVPSFCEVFAKSVRGWWVAPTVPHIQSWGYSSAEERLLCKQRVAGSSPAISTIFNSGGDIMELQCQICGNNHLKEIGIDRYSDAIFRRIACCDCGCEFVAKYNLAEIVTGSVRAGESPPSLKGEPDIGAQIIRQLFASAIVRQTIPCKEVER